MPFLKSIFTAFSRKERRVFTAALLLAALSLIAGAFFFIFSKTEMVPAAAGTYREGLIGQPAFVNPVLAKSSADKSLVRLLFANAKDLADAVETQDGGRTVRVHLKSNLRWSDNQDITSDDVIFTVEQIQDPDAASPLFTAWRDVKAERVSQLEVAFRLPAPYAFFEENLGDLYVIPKHIYAGIPPANWKFSDYNLRPIGGGPYVFVSRETEPDGFVSAYHLKVNARYNGQKPYIQNFDFIFERNRDDLLRDFNSGRLEGFFTSDPQVLSEIRRPYDPALFPGTTYYAVFWNQSSNAALADPDVRAALAAAVDRIALSGNIFGEAAVPVDGPSFWKAEDGAGASVEAAAALLDKKGWKPGEDGIRSRKDGKQVTFLRFTLTVPDISFLAATANALKEAWSGIGADVSLKVQPLDEVVSDAVKNRAYDAVLFGNTLPLSGDLFSFWHSKERFSPGQNLSLYENKRADALIESIRGGMDAAKRGAEEADLAALIRKDNPALFLFSPSYEYVLKKNVDGVESALLKDPADRFANVSAWYVATTRVLK